MPTTATNRQLPELNARTRARTRTREPRPFVALDGEGAELADGEHAYVCLVSSSGRSVANPAGLTTREALSFIVREGRVEPRPILVGFFFNYDVNMILRDLPRELLAELWRTGSCVWELADAAFELAWIPTKLFEINAELVTPAGTVRGAAKLYDTFGFFQQSFVKACKAWGLGDRLERIEQMKARRGMFTLAELDAMTDYAIDECELLVELMNRVRDALHAVDLHPRSWLGAGAIASTLLGRENVPEHLPPVRRRPALDDAVMRAYFGGRTEVFRQGVHELAESWDINSAYPHAATSLPTLRGTWKRRREYEPAPWAVWRVRWELDPGELVAPFPFRHRRAITFPLAGEGYYHAAEVAAAIDLFGDRIDVTSGYVFEPDGDELPFAFLADIYRQRQDLKAQGHAGEKVLKLGINSVYGKLAQGNARDGRRPRFQSYFWAGAITATTRARILRAIAGAPEQVVAVATDGIVFAPKGPSGLVATSGLGGWERTRYRDFFVAQPGMYHATDRRTNTRVRHSRGFFAREVDFPKLRRTWNTFGPASSLASSSTRFVGLGSALMRTDFDIWRTWQTGERRISLYLSPRKRYVDLEPERVKQLFPPERVAAGLSEIYVPKYTAVELDPELADWVQGGEQPVADT